MKDYEVDLMTVWYDTIAVRANSPEEAEAKARLVEPVLGLSECTCEGVRELSDDSEDTA
jgi:hypothetical protein